MGYWIAFAVGALIGSVLTVVLLSKENLEKYNRVSNTVSDNYAAAKAVYKAEIYGSQNKNEGEDE